MQSDINVKVIKKGWFIFRPTLSLEMRYKTSPGSVFQVGEFRDWESAFLSRDRLIEELNVRSRISINGDGG